jgi:Uma2 family endonuclease
MLANNHVHLPRHRLTVADFHKMGESGILGESARVELIEGELIDMAPIGSSHAGTVDHLARVFFTLAGDVIVRVQNPLALGSHSEPEPDLALVLPRDDFYTRAHPEPKDVVLLIEVADTSMDYDREIKIPLYARHGIPEAWLIDLSRKEVEVYLRPHANGYRQILRPGIDERIGLLQLPSVVLTVGELFVP